MGRLRVRRTLLVPLVVLALALGACSSAGSAAPLVGGEPGDAGLVVSGARGAAPAPPRRILSASATHTEILYAIGAGDRVVATDMFSDYPLQAGSTSKVDAFNLGVEAVAELDPDLVILTFDPGEVADGLRAMGIPVLLFAAPQTLEDAYGQILAVGEATGLDREASDLVGSMRAEIGAIVAGLPVGGVPQTYYFELDPSLVSLTSGTFVGSLLSMLNLQSVADAVDVGESGGYPQLSAEYLLMANPDLIFLADTVCCGQSTSAVAERPGWGVLGAVTGDRVIELDDDVASRWGPRLVDLMAVVAAAVYGGEGTG
jgi:iron complex transport system substrate-binding protein